MEKGQLNISFFNSYNNESKKKLLAKYCDEQFKNDALEHRKNHAELTTSAVWRNLGISSSIYYQWKSSTKENNGQVSHIESRNNAIYLKKHVIPVFELLPI